MARTIRPEDAQVRLAIRTDYDANPGQTYKDLQDKFGVNYSSVILAMKRTADEWRAMLDASAAGPAKPLATVSKVYSEAQVPSSIPVKRGRGRPPAAKPGAQQVAMPAQAASQPPATIQAPARPATWEYKSIVVRGKADSGAATFEFQDSGSACWQSVAAKGFDGVLAVFGRDGWELVHVTVLNHGNQAFTGLFEIVFKRAR
jgi:hypothetical protein